MLYKFCISLSITLLLQVSGNEIFQQILCKNSLTIILNYDLTTDTCTLQYSCM